ncbi:MAG: hypothetical protein ACJ8C4_20715 [Gemmataceae bacterium]
MRGRAIGEFLDALFEGDPVALGLVGVVLVILLLFGLFVLKVRRDLRREDDEQARRYGRNTKSK